MASKTLYGSVLLIHFDRSLSALESSTKKLQMASAEEEVNLNFLSLILEHLLKRIKPFRIVYFKSELHYLHLSEDKYENNGGPK